MNHSKRNRHPLCLFVLALFIALFSKGAFSQPSVNAVSIDWNNPAFVKRFVGSYGFEGSKEPKINSSESALFKRVASLMASKNLFEAERLIKNALTSESSAALDFALGNILYQSGNLASAADAYRKAIKKFPSFMRAHKNLAYVYARQSDYASAVKAFSKTIQLGGFDGDTYGLLAFCYLNQQKYGSALEGFEEAMLFMPDFMDWKIGKIQCLFAMERHHEVIAMCNEILLSDNSRDEIWGLQANAYLALDRPMEAAKNIEVLRRMKRADGNFLVLLGNIYLNEGVVDLAIEAFNEALDVREIPPPSRVVRVAEALTNRNRWTAAAAFIKRIKPLYPGKFTQKQEVDILVMEAEIALATSQSEQAVATLLKIVEREPLHGKSRILLGDYHASIKEIEQAEFYYKEAARIPEFRWQAQVNHAQMYVSEARYDEAITLLESAQSIKPRKNIANYLKAVEEAARVRIE